MQAQAEPRFSAAADKLDRLAQFARSEMPFAFYARVLGAERGRMRFLARLGHEADDPLQESLNLALDYERHQTASLQGFMASPRRRRPKSSATWRFHATRCA